MPEPRPPLIDKGEPYAEVTCTGRWTWYVTVHHGITQWGPDGYGWIVFGNRKRADRKAIKVLDKYRREDARYNDRHRID